MGISSDAYKDGDTKRVQGGAGGIRSNYGTMRAFCCLPRHMLHLVYPWSWVLLVLLYRGVK